MMVTTGTTREGELRLALEAEDGREVARATGRFDVAPLGTLTHDLDSRCQGQGRYVLKPRPSPRRAPHRQPAQGDDRRALIATSDDGNGVTSEARSVPIVPATPRGVGEGVCPAAASRLAWISAAPGPRPAESPRARP